jgi:hypothetical protein
MTSDLGDEFARQAEWRREKARQYPNDKRNAEAATIFDRLASSAERCPPEISEAASELLDDVRDGEVWSEMMKEVGFWYFPSTAETFCRDFISKQTSGTA